MQGKKTWAMSGSESGFLGRSLTDLQICSMRTVKKIGDKWFIVPTSENEMWYDDGNQGTARSP